MSESKIRSSEQEMLAHLKNNKTNRHVKIEAVSNLKSAVDFEYHYHFLTLATYLMCDDNRNSDADNRLQ